MDCINLGYVRFKDAISGHSSKFTFILLSLSLSVGRCKFFPYTVFLNAVLPLTSSWNCNCWNWNGRVRQINQTVCTSMYLYPSFTPKWPHKPPPNFVQTTPPTQTKVLNTSKTAKTWPPNPGVPQTPIRSLEKKLCFTKNIQMGTIKKICLGQRRTLVG